MGVWFAVRTLKAKYVFSRLGIDCVNHYTIWREAKVGIEPTCLLDIAVRT